MNYNTNYSKIITDENLMETIQHGEKEYPFHFYYDNLALFDFNCVNWHWHTEIEFVYVQSGTVTFCIGTDQITLSEGNAVFINSKALHKFYSEDNAVIPNFVCYPTFIAPIETRIYNKYVQPIISSAIGYQIFSPTLPWQKEILDILQEIFIQQNSDCAKELMTSSLIQKLWAVFFKHIDTANLNQQQEYSAHSQIKLQVMMQYIHTNYSFQIALSDIAQSAGISKSSALSFFHKYLKMAPVSYLILYRLKKASELLITTDLKLVEVAYATGFNNIGYFCKQFKIHYGITPTEYRKLKAQNK